MKPFTWKPGMTDREEADGAYWERNMLALHIAVMESGTTGICPDSCGWYKHEGEGFEGWSRVISLHDGQMTFHVPDDFDLGKLQEIEPNWDGHSTEEKWLRVMGWAGCEL